MISREEIKDYFHTCSSCKGTGSIYVDSHDCWGKSEWYSRTCYACGGYGFCMDSNLKREIKATLGL